MLASVDCVFPWELFRFSWSSVCWVILGCILDILNTRPWTAGSYLNLLESINFFFFNQVGDLVRFRLHNLVCFLWAVMQLQFSLQSIYSAVLVHPACSPPSCQSENQASVTHAQLKDEPGASQAISKDLLFQLPLHDSAPHFVQGFPFLVFRLESWVSSLPTGSAVLRKRKSCSVLALAWCRAGRPTGAGPSGTTPGWEGEGYQFLAGVCLE